jgi:hypothetical protein
LKQGITNTLALPIDKKFLVGACDDDIEAAATSSRQAASCNP